MMLKQTMAVAASMLLACGGDDAEGNDGTEGLTTQTSPTSSPPTSTGSNSDSASVGTTPYGG